jgi:hypothetical protein
MNSSKETIKKTNKSTGVKRAAEVSSPATSPLRIAPKNSTLESKKALANKAIGPVSTPAPTVAKVSANVAKANDARTSVQTFAALAVTPPAPAPRALAIQDRKASAPKSGVSASKATTIEAKIDVGFGNTLYLRGQGPGLSWERGVPCECVDRNTWRWTAPRAEKLTFKLLLNDSVWARGADLVIGPGEKVEIVPAF